MENKGSIIVVGAGTTGTAVFYLMLSEHPHLAPVSGKITPTFTDRLELGRLLMKGIDDPLLGEVLKRRTKSGESYTFWEYIWWEREGWHTAKRP
jgi:hypothetical protein